MAYRKYSTAERNLLELLPDNGDRISTTALARAHYGRRFSKRIAPCQTVTWTLQSLREKAENNGETFTV